MPRALLAASLAALVAAAAPAVATADPPTTLVIRNLGATPTRVQVALGDALPCDSSENRRVLDRTIGPHEMATLHVDAVKACARHTRNGSTIDWSPSTWIYGGVTCDLRACWSDPSVVMRYDVGG